MKTRALFLGAAASLVLGGGLLIATPGAVDAEKQDKEFVCHHTSSETNPVVIIHISGNAVDKHLENHGGTGDDSAGSDPEECVDDGDGDGGGED